MNSPSMKAVFLFISFFGALAYAAQVRKDLSTHSMKREASLKMKESVRQTGNCTLNLCFAFDGSGSISGSEFESQKGFIADLTSIISVELAVTFAAVQYGFSIEPVTELTSDVIEFLEKTFSAEQLRSPGTYISGGINYCADQLHTRKRPNAIVLLSDGRHTVIGSPVLAANRFRDEGGEIFAVAVGFADRESLLEIVGGNATKVFGLGISDVLSLDAILLEHVKKVCGSWL